MLRKSARYLGEGFNFCKTPTGGSSNFQTVVASEMNLSVMTTALQTFRLPEAYGCIANLLPNSADQGWSVFSHLKLLRLAVIFAFGFSLLWFQFFCLLTYVWINAVFECIKLSHVIK